MSLPSLKYHTHTSYSISVAQRNCLYSNANCFADGRLSPRERELLAPRRSQLEILEEAKQRNTIAYLGTGTGKTLISVLLIKALSAELRRKDVKKLSFLLCIRWVHSTLLFCRLFLFRPLPGQLKWRRIVGIMPLPFLSEEGVRHETISTFHSAPRSVPPFVPLSQAANAQNSENHAMLADGPEERPFGISRRA
jgi:hypothetical protein